MGKSILYCILRKNYFGKIEWFRCGKSKGFRTRNIEGFRSAGSWLDVCLCKKMMIWGTNFLENIHRTRVSTNSMGSKLNL